METAPGGRTDRRPLRATLPLSSLVRNAPASDRAQRPSPSPNHGYHRGVPSPGHRSPGAPVSLVSSPYIYRGKCGSRSVAMRRTASLDAIHQRGPRSSEDYCLYSIFLQVDKATQTDDNNGKNGGASSFTTSADVPSEDKLDKFLRHRLQRTNLSRGAAEHASQTMSPVFSIKSGGTAPLRAARSSVEGLNQEIERLVLCHTPPHCVDRCKDKVTPEGHRAPVVELLRRSVNTQTPAPVDGHRHSAQSSGGSVCSSPDFDSSRLGTSPHINRFLAREPPDGCEKVNLRFTEYISGTKGPTDISPIKPSTGFQLRPSLGSAFQPLQPPTPTECSSSLRSSAIGDDRSNV